MILCARPEVHVINDPVRLGWQPIVKVEQLSHRSGRDTKSEMNDQGRIAATVANFINVGYNR